MNKQKDKLNLKKERDNSSPVTLKILVFFFILAAGFLVSFLIPLRPSVSASEKRLLSPFPSFSAESLFEGQYFKDIDLWFSDTFPFREKIILVNGALHRLYGINAVQIKGDVEQGDDIPDAPPKPSLTSSPPATSAPATPVTTTTAATTQAADLGDTQTFGAVLLYGNQAFEYYNFRKDMAARYAALINKTAAKMSGVNFYEMIVPNSTAITLPENMKSSINSSDQEKAINYMYNLMEPSVKTVNVYDTLIAHHAEYVYFRTDHHWTALGAYYGYEQWAKAKGVEPVPLDKYEKVTYDGFLGSFYASTNKNTTLSKTPDAIEVFKPFNSTQMTITDKKDKVFKWSVVTDVTGWGAESKYSTFIGGDNPYTLIENKDLTDGSSCFVFKESYANAFIPFLVPHYQKIHIVDYRYWKGNVANFVSQNGVKDVFFINNISATRSEALIARMEKLTG
ncbi:MAG TPA: DHHW family protein [Clostridia bacterium]|nr:DHHW family protein [Clostridia bacterium]